MDGGGRKNVGNIFENGRGPPKAVSALSRNARRMVTEQVAWCVLNAWPNVRGLGDRMVWNAQLRVFLAGMQDTHDLNMIRHPLDHQVIRVHDNLPRAGQPAEPIQVRMLGKGRRSGLNGLVQVIGRNRVGRRCSPEWSRVRPVPRAATQPALRFFRFDSMRARISAIT